MDRLRFEPGADDVATLYRRLLGERPALADHAASLALWDAMAAELTRVITLAAAGGCTPIALETVDVALVKVVRKAKDLEQVAFAAGLKAGAALAPLQPPSRN